jgi:hypothetical protein
MIMIVTTAVTTGGMILTMSMPTKVMVVTTTMATGVMDCDDGDDGDGGDDDLVGAAGVRVGVLLAVGGPRIRGGCRHPPCRGHLGTDQGKDFVSQEWSLNV